jgi:spore maturation protein CgeB
VTETLRAMGCTANLFHTRGRASGWGAVAQKVWHKVSTVVLREPELLLEPALLKRVDAFAPTLILVLLGNQLSPKTVAAIRRRCAAPIVCWCQDQMTTLGRQFLLAAGYDAVFLKDRFMQDLFSRMIRSTQFHYLPEACNPQVHRPIELTAADRATFGCDVSIAGTLYYYRQEILSQLEGLDVKIWGYRPDWLLDKLPGRFMGRDVHGDDKVRAALASRICLNTLHYAEVDGLNCRAFELAGCGGFQFVASVPVLREHFEPDVEIISYSSIEELKEKAAHFLRNPEQAAAIAERGRARAHHDHNYERRLGEILRIAAG